MDKQPKKELVEGIKDFLRDFEEPFDQAEWKRFQRYRGERSRKPIPLFIKFAGIAASFVLMVYASVKLLPLVVPTGGKDERVTPDPRKAESRMDSLESDTLYIDSIPPKTSALTFSSEMEEGGKTVFPKKESVNAGSKENRYSFVPIRGISLPVIPDSPGYGSLDSSLYAKGRLHTGSKWMESNTIRIRRLPTLELPDLSNLFGGTGGVNAGIHLNPGISEKGLFIGGGIYAKLPVSTKVSIGFGLDYSNLKIGKNWKPNETDTISQQLVGVTNSIGMFSVPVSVNYAFSESFSAGMGIAPFRVLGSQRKDLFQSNKWVTGNVLEGDSIGRMVSERTSQIRADTLYKGNTYLGFIQVSGQYSPPILRKYNLTVAPFISVPIGKLRQDEYQWLHGGVSFRIYFR